jgi:protein-disulfide isomerase
LPNRQNGYLPVRRRWGRIELKERAGADGTVCAGALRSFVPPEERNRMKNILDIVATLVMAVVAIAIGYSYFFSSGDAEPGLPPATIQDWADTVTALSIVAPDQRDLSTYSVQIVEFVDFQCLFCKQYAATLDSIRVAFPDDVHLQYVHFPLLSHPHANQAAQSAECADRQGAFARMHDELFARQDEMGLAEWYEFAVSAGLPDLDAFSACMRLPLDSFPQILAGRELALEWGITGTPSTLVNGQVRRATMAVIEEALRAAR